MSIIYSIQTLIQHSGRAISYISFKDIVDILIVALCIYLILIFIKQTRSFFLFSAVIILFGFNFLAQQFDLALTRQFFEPLLTFFIALFVIVFQPEIRKFFKWFSSGRRVSFAKTLSLPENNIQTIVRAIFEMAKLRIGAIIVIPGEYPLDDMLEGGFPLDGKISFPLILSIFDPTSPGHDGAILIQGSTIKMFGLHLPLAREFAEFARVGTRHRAAAGITERTDALALVVSEERGEVSVSQKGVLTKVETPEALADIIAKFTHDETKEDKEQSRGMLHYFFLRNSYSKIIALALAMILWFFLVYKIGIVKADYTIPIEYRYIDTALSIKTSTPNSVNVTVSGNNRDIANLKNEDIKVLIDASKFKLGENNFTIQKAEVQAPNYIQVTNYSPKAVKARLDKVIK